jgi:serine protease Do
MRVRRKTSYFLILALLPLASCQKQNEEKAAKRESTAMTVPWKDQAIGADTFIKISKLADPAVVNIGTTKVIKQKRNPRGFMFGPEGGSPFDDFFGGDDLFRRFFGEQPDQPDFKQQSLGSGFILSEDGFIATNNHVVEKADEITVTIGKDHEYKAKLVGADPKTDVALLKITPKEKLSPLVLGDSDDLQVGEIVVAIGNPFGLSHTVTQGIVSAKERAIGFGSYDNFIQTDASINPGNSGGPLLNLKAEVIGINAAIVASGQGIGFAIPINLAKNILAQLREKGAVTRGWLGVYIQKVDPDLAKTLDMKERKGALVSNVQPGSPAEKVGIQRGDVIVKFNGKEIRDFNDLPRLVAETAVGTKVKVELVRNGKSLTFEPTILELKGDGEEGSEEETVEPKTSQSDSLGLTVSNLTTDIRRQLQLDPASNGVVVQKVTPMSGAGEKGVQRGDLIVEVNRHKVANVDDYRKYTKSLKKGDTVLLLVKRGEGTTLFIAFMV